MANDVLNTLLREYEQKKVNAELDLERRKELIYKLIPRLLEIDDELNSLGIQSAKSILISPEKRDFYVDELNKKIKDLKSEKESILLKNGYSLDYFKPFYECKLCNDTGFITDENSNTVMCSCLKQKLFDLEYNKFNTFDMSNCTFNNFLTEVYSPTVEKEKYNSSLSPRENIKIIRKICDTFILNFDDPHDKNLLFTGNTGLGKTFLSNCIANELLKKGKVVLYQTAPIMLDSIINYRMRKS